MLIIYGTHIPSDCKFYRPKSQCEWKSNPFMSHSKSDNLRGKQHHQLAAHPTGMTLPHVFLDPLRRTPDQ